MNGLRKCLMLACAVGALGLAACSSDDPLDPKTLEAQPVGSLYNSAADAMDKKDYRTAVVLFEEVDVLSTSSLPSLRKVGDRSDELVV